MIAEEPQFITYAVSGAFAFSGLLVYVTSSPIIFMEVFKVSVQTFGAIFAGLATGFIGSNQINVLLLRKFSSEQIFRATLLVECPVASLLLVGTIFSWFGLPATLVLLFIVLSSLGLAYPNAAALALVPFDRNIGSAARDARFSCKSGSPSAGVRERGHIRLAYNDAGGADSGNDLVDRVRNFGGGKPENPALALCGGKGR